MSRISGQITLLVTILAFFFLLTGCGNKSDTNPGTLNEKKEMNLDINQSWINWTVNKNNGKHTGTLKFLKGNFRIESGVPVSGTCIVDLNSINLIDVKDSAENRRIVDIIKSKNFLNTEKYPLSTVSIRSIVPLRYEKMPTINTTVKGSLTVKDSTLPMVVSAFTRYSKDSVVTNANFSFLSRLWNIPFKSLNIDKDFKENPYDDELDMEIYIVAK